jgi:hypothetical protein
VKNFPGEAPAPPLKREGEEEKGREGSGGKGGDEGEKRVRERPEWDPPESLNPATGLADIHSIAVPVSRYDNNLIEP